MRAIGPYVVVREVTAPPVVLARVGGTRADPHPGSGQGPAGPPSEGENAGGQTLWVTDRLTGMPALLHEVARPLPTLPPLPPHPALLMPTDQLIEQGRIFVVTELPLGAAPAQDPLLAARAALGGLDALHSQGLAHGALGPGHLWSAGGQVMLTGGGLHPLDGDYTVARDLHDLALTLEGLGGLPPELALLRAAPERLGAQEALALLDGPLPAPLPTPVPTRPPLQPMSLLGGSEPLPQRSDFVQRAAPGLDDPRPAAPAPAKSPDVSEPLNLDLSEWTLPDFLATSPQPESAEATDPPTDPVRSVGPATGRVLNWATPNRAGDPAAAPTPEAVPEDGRPPASQQAAGPLGAARRALSRLKADASRQAARAPTRERVAGSPLPEAGASAAADLTPQERRRQWTQAQAEAQAHAQMQAQDGDATSQVRPTPSPLSPDAPAPQPVSRRTLKPLRATLGDDGQWKVQRHAAGQTGDRPPTAPPRLLTWTLPLWAARVRPWVWAAALAAVALLAALLALALGQGGRSAQACCAVQFAVQGGSQQRATLTLEDVPSGSSDQAGRVLGQVPGTVRFAGQGRYVLRVSAPGFTPAALTLDVPVAAQPVLINLKP